MGLLDILNGMQNGPRGSTQPAQPGQSSGMSPLTMALLGLLAYKALQGSGGLGNILGGSRPQAAPPSDSPSGGIGDILGGLLGGSRPQAAPPGDSPSGGIGDILGGLLGGASPGGRPTTGGLGDILGGMLGGPNAGNALNGGLRNLIGDMEDNGQGDIAKSWVGPGANKPIAPNDLANALGADTIDKLSTQTGMPRDQLLSELSRNLPQLVDQLTPNGRLPTDHEAARW